LHRNGSHNSARLEHLIQFDGRREAQQDSGMPTAVAGRKILAGQADETAGRGGCGPHSQLPPDGISTQFPHRESRLGGAIRLSPVDLSLTNRKDAGESVAKIRASMIRTCASLRLGSVRYQFFL